MKQYPSLIHVYRCNQERKQFRKDTYLFSLEKKLSEISESNWSDSEIYSKVHQIRFGISLLEPDKLSQIDQYAFVGLNWSTDFLTQRHFSIEVEKDVFTAIPESMILYYRDSPPIYISPLYIIDHSSRRVLDSNLTSAMGKSPSCSIL